MNLFGRFICSSYIDLIKKQDSSTPRPTDLKKKKKIIDLRKLWQKSQGVSRDGFYGIEGVYSFHFSGLRNGEIKRDHDVIILPMKYSL